MQVARMLRAAAPLVCCVVGSRAQESLTVVPGRIPYMGEAVGHVVVTTAPDRPGEELTLEVATVGGTLLGKGAVLPGQRSAVEIPLGELPDGETALHCRLLAGGTEVATADTRLTELPPKPHAVQIDNRRRGLVVDGLPFFPFGFYSGEAAPRIPQDLAAQGFNLYAPYSGGWHGTTELLEEIRTWMDRCAEVGVKVNYDLRYDYYFRKLKLDGARIMGGTWVDEMTPGQKKRLRTEIEAFRDHPALLSWYIADEPHKDVDFARLTAMRKFVKELDPYHPVSIVFCEGHRPGAKWREISDVAWLDPYPVNILSRDQRSNPYWEALPPEFRRGVASMTACWLSRHDRLFGYSSPLWHSPQCFGGGWPSQKREPSAQELRAMTYAGLITGATAIQYFMYSPGVFPTSPRLVAEAGRLAQEVIELTPFLLSEEPRRKVTASDPAVLVAGWQDRGLALVAAVNADNAPAGLHVTLADCGYSGSAEVLFENRQVEVREGVIEDTIEAQGTRIYQIPEGPFPVDRVTASPGNLRANASFEEWVNAASPPDIMVRRAAGCTCFLDARTAVHGRHSLRLTAAGPDALKLTFNRVEVEPDKRYRVSLWAKADRPGVGLRLTVARTDRGDGEPFALGTEWEEHSVLVTAQVSAEKLIGPRIQFDGPGTVWLDSFQIVPAE